MANENLSNDFSTTLAAAITGAGDLTITVASSTGAPDPNFRIRVGDELMLVTAVAHPTWTVTRGVEGSTAATHLNGADVAHVVTAGGLSQNAKDLGGIFKASVDTGVTRTIETGYQQVAAGPFTIDGVLVVDGTFAVI